MAMGLAKEKHRTLRLELEGMTCAACAARIEKKLNAVEGVEATVNFATEEATVSYDTDVAVQQLVAAVRPATEPVKRMRRQWRAITITTSPCVC
jgi:copper chaperone CopZ